MTCDGNARQVAAEAGEAFGISRLVVRDRNGADKLGRRIMQPQTDGGAAVADEETNQQAPQEFWYSGHTFQGARQSLAGDDADQCGIQREDERRRGDRGCHRPATAVAHRRRCSTARNTANQPFCDRAADDAADDETDRRRGHRQTHYAEDVVLFGKALRIGGTSPVPANQGD